MMPVFPAPILLPDLLSQVSAGIFSIIVITFATLLYLALVLAPFWREPKNNSRPQKQPKDSIEGEKK